MKLFAAPKEVAEPSWRDSIAAFDLKRPFRLANDIDGDLCLGLREFAQSSDNLARLDLANRR